MYTLVCACACLLKTQNSTKRPTDAIRKEMTTKNKLRQFSRVVMVRTTSSTTADIAVLSLYYYCRRCVTI